MFQSYKDMQKAKIRSKRVQMDIAKQDWDRFDEHNLPETFANELSDTVFGDEKSHYLSTLKSNFHSLHFVWPVGACVSISAAGKTWQTHPNRTPQEFLTVHGNTEEPMKSAIENAVLSLTDMEDEERRLEFFLGGLLKFPVSISQLRKIIPSIFMDKVGGELAKAVDIQASKGAWEANTKAAFKTYLQQMQPVIDGLKERAFYQEALMD